MSWIEAALGRREHEIPLPDVLPKSALITGANGSIGIALTRRLEELCVKVHATDIEDLDVTNGTSVGYHVSYARPDVIFHLAGAKHAPMGESDPWGVTMTNTIGTHNVLERANGARVVVASTCKACNPETAYGASKLIAERMALNAGQTVARFYNVVPTAGNVFEIWRDTPRNEPLPVTDCTRYFVSLREAVGLTLWASSAPSGRYTVAPGIQRRMWDVAAAVHPGRKLVQMAARRGDRLDEPLCAKHECVLCYEGEVNQIVSHHDGKEIEWQLLQKAS